MDLSDKDNNTDLTGSRQSGTTKKEKEGKFGNRAAEKIQYTSDS